MWISTATSLPKPGQMVWYAAGPVMYRGSFQGWFVRASDDGPVWLSASGRRVTHWMPVESCVDSAPLPPSPRA